MSKHFLQPHGRVSGVSVYHENPDFEPARSFQENLKEPGVQATFHRKGQILLALQQAAEGVKPAGSDPEGFKSEPEMITDEGWAPSCKSPRLDNGPNSCCAQARHGGITLFPHSADLPLVRVYREQERGAR